MKNKITFQTEGSKDYMGFVWVGIYNYGNPVKKNNSHLRYNVKSINEAKKLWTREIDSNGYPK
jgi:hypothetical protein